MNMNLETYGLKPGRESIAKISSPEKNDAAITTAIRICSPVRGSKTKRSPGTWLLNKPSIGFLLKYIGALESVPDRLSIVSTIIPSTIRWYCLLVVQTVCSVEVPR